MAVVSYKDTMQRLLRNPMRRTYTFLGVSLVVVLVFLLGAIRPTVITISNLRSEIAERKAVNEKLQTKINTLQTLQTQYIENQDKLDLLDSYFPSDADYSILMANLEQICKSYGYELFDIQIQTTSVDEISPKYLDMQQVEVRLVVIGPRSEMIGLIDYLEELPVLPQVSSVSYVPEDSETAGDVRLNLQMDIYKQVYSTTNLAQEE